MHKIRRGTNLFPKFLTFVERVVFLLLCSRERTYTSKKVSCGRRIVHIIKSKTNGRNQERKICLHDL
ncbi:MAG TPA: hypothetical protein DDY68_01725 [Porphyromonadaceae bacterium]|nr:hypothetical protein [Porphyromonadaceae bacterium]